MAECVDFYFDFSSSYSYIALPEVTRLGVEAGVDIRWKPFLLGVIFQSLGHAPAEFSTVKGRYIERDVERCADQAGLPYKWPKPFPFNSMTAARAFWHLADEDDDQAVEWAKAVFHASFGEGRDCSDPAILADVADRLGHDARVLLEATGTDPVKQSLRRVTEEAMERGVFGAPTFFVDDEMFWGGDRLGALTRYLGIA
jgi:2-hydroxychromene-2-carboxylate isomerase